MKFKKTFVYLLAAVMALSALSGCGGGSSDKDGDDGDKEPARIASNWTVMPENANPNFKYFGYYHSDGFGGSRAYFQDIDALENANVYFVNTQRSNAETAQMLSDAKDKGMLCIVSVYGIFFAAEAGAKDNKLILPGYQASWNSFISAITPYMDTVLGFYFDEPYWLSVKKDAFWTATKFIADAYPDKKIMSCTSAMEFGASTWGSVPQVPADYYKYCTDLAYDYYVEWNDTARFNYLKMFKERVANNGQNLWAVPRAFEDNPMYTKGSLTIAHMKGFYTEAIQDERYVGMALFSYASGIDYDWGYGLVDMFNEADEDTYCPAAKDIIIQIGKAVIANNI